MSLVGRVLGTVLVVGGAAVLVAAVVSAPKLLRAARPLAREALKRGFDVYERARTASAQFADDVEDLVAEVRADVSKKAAAE
jgi:hypothetical protein